MFQSVSFHVPVWQGSCKVAFNVGVHDWFKMLKLAILEQVYNVDLNDKKMHIYNKQNVISLSCIVPKKWGSLPTRQSNTFSAYLCELSSKMPKSVSSVSCKNW